MSGRIAISFIGLSLLCGVILGIVITNPAPAEPTRVVEYIVDNSAAIRRLVLEEAVINGFAGVQRLIVMDVNLSENVTIDASFASWDVFRIAQKITFYATGVYTTDLGLLTENDIIFDDHRRTIVARLPRPVIDSITIHEEQTVFHSVERGVLRFGEIRLTAAEQNEITRQVKESMQLRMQLDLMAQAEAYTKWSVEGLIRKFLAAAPGTDDYTITIVWS